MRRLVGCDRATSIDRPQGHIYGGGGGSQRAPLVALQSGEQIWNQMRNRVSQYKSQITHTHVHVRSIACTPHAHPRASTSALRWSGGPDTVTRTELFCTRNVVRGGPHLGARKAIQCEFGVQYRRAKSASVSKNEEKCCPQLYSTRDYTEITYLDTQATWYRRNIPTARVRCRVTELSLKHNVDVQKIVLHIHATLCTCLHVLYEM